MGSRMDKYNNDSNIPKRSVKNQELYKQIYNAYDEFENLVVPSNVKEIDLSDLRKEITSRNDYKQVKEFRSITNTNNKVVRKEIVLEEQKKENEIYDINELLNKAVKDKKPDGVSENIISSDSYLKRLKLDDTRTNLDMVKDIYENIKRETAEENESDSLLKTANLSLEILSDLKGDNDNTIVEAPIKDEFLPESSSQFYSNEYKFSKKDFENNRMESSNKEDDFYDNELSEGGSGKFFFKILLLIFGISMIVVIIIYLVNYFNRV